MAHYPDYCQLRKDLLAGKTSCRERVLWHLRQIRENNHLNAFLTVYDQEALHFADITDQKIREGKAGRLAGLVVGLKDVLSYKGHPLQGSSKILSGFKAQYNATAVQRLIDEDAIIIGRQNCDEFGMGSSNENSSFGPALNPHNINHTPGGSSGGSAAAVAADLCQVSLGSDTGGSVRQPASFCGVWGLKPTYSRVSRHGLIAYASSFDCIGILANSAQDCALVLEVIAGADDYDSTVSRAEVPRYLDSIERSQNRELKIAVLSNFPIEGMQPDVLRILNQKSEGLKKAGHRITGFHFPFQEQVLPAYYILTTAEASSNLSRYDGVRYGYRSREADDLESMYKQTRTEGFGEEVRRRILLGNFVLSSDYYDSYFSQAQKVRRMISESLRELFKSHDLLLMPAAPSTAMRLGEHQNNPVKMFLSDLFTVQANIAGLPAVTVPCGKDQNNLPVGLQLMADPFREELLLEGAIALSKVS
ncbi:MAG: Asp-tRNA(Asn)/Glu-tRNA(Gln) amidotransferase subunit GatA [Cyclobacteriaceae bacterium]